MNETPAPGNLPARSRSPPLIVGIGSSAGGIEALEAFFRRMPRDSGMAFVLVTHLPRGHTSTLHEILSRCTEMPVVVATDNAEILADHIYAAPADSIVTVAADRLHLHDRVGELQRKPIDVFLSSLAESRGESAVGILLSGAGSDGTLGIKSIKEKGGLTLAQGPDGSAPKQPSMPETAIAAGVVDLVLSIEKMPERLAEFARGFRPSDVGEGDGSGDPVNSSIKTIYRILLNRVGHDFSGYKEKTFMRRLRRRMQVVQVDRLEQYVERLRAEPDEVGLLFRDLLIGVTSFFRDPEAFAALEQQVIPKLFEGRGVSDSVRVWVPACATGEEVYSLAILLREHMETLRAPPKVTVFATDIDDAALVVARSGRYPASLLDKVSPQRLNRFFTGDEVSYSVKKDIRDLCIFSPHSVIRDPPFSRMDLISCRNLLIYFGVDYQSHVIPLFHFALRQRGYLFLGTSENVSQHAELFAPVDRRARIFRRRDAVAAPFQFPFLTPAGHAAPPSAENRSDASTVATLRRSVETRVLDRHAPAHVVINRDGDVLHYSARTGKYIEPAPGLPNRQLITMARRGLRLDLRNALREAIQTRHAVTRHGIAIEVDDRIQRIDLTVEPLGDNDVDPMFLVLFTDVGAPFPANSEPPAPLLSDRTAERLEQELRETRERLQATIEEYETAVEELKSSNEELQSTNEELQSTNEELETAKEELQSVNEELQTVNQELNAKIEEVDRAHTDLRNVFDSTQIPTIFVDENLLIRGFTPAVGAIFNLIPSDRGRPLTDIVSHLSESGDLHRDMRSVLDNGEPIERNVTRSDKSASFRMHIMPYRGRNNTIEGVLVTFFDISKMLATEAHQRTLVEELNHRVRNMLSVVGAIASQMLARQPDPAKFVESFLGRLAALGKLYTLVSLKQWQPVALAEILNAELSAHAGQRDTRIAVEGPEIKFNPAQAFALGLVIHELTTNAVKYGALSNETGRLSVRWRLHDGQILFDWCEAGGKGGGAVPGRGFGTDLIERQMAGVFRAKPEIRYAPDGLQLHVAIPLEAIRSADPPQG